MDIKRASSGFLDTASSVDIGWVFTGTFPKKEKSIDIGFLNLGFSQEFGSNFLLDGFGLGLGLLVFRDTWIFISINFEYKARFQ